MRKGLLLIACTLVGCSTPPQNLAPLSETAFSPAIAPRHASKDPDEVLAQKAQGCPGSKAFPFSKQDDSYEKVRARWKLLNCLHKGPSPRKLVVLLDGTANDKEDSTNIWRLYNLALARSIADKNDDDTNGGQRVIPFYDKGVGTDPYTPISGAMFGSGVSINIRQGYRFLAEAYQPGDQIYLFGFSRGAFTARSLNGFIEFAGLAKLDSVRPDTLDSTFLLRWAGNFHRKIEGMYEVYHTPNNGSAAFEKALRTKLKEYREKEGIRIHGDEKGETKPVVEVIGVFDTVPAIGFGLDEDPDGHRLELYANRGYHAMSLDEQRDSFRLQRFGVPQYDYQQLDEVWFAGAHADVGGGYANGFNASICTTTQDPQVSAAVGLEATPLRWMLERVGDQRLFASTPWPQECLNATLHDEYFDAPSVLSHFYQNAGLLRRKPVNYDKVHGSVLARMNFCKLPNSHPEREPERKYRPVNLGHDPEKTFTIVNRYSVSTEPCAPSSQDAAASVAK